MRYLLSLLCALQLTLSVASAQAPKNPTIPFPINPKQQMVWNGEQSYFRYLKTKDLNNFMALWDDDFVGWPDYSESPLHKPDIQTAVVEEFKNPASSLSSLPGPNAEAIRVFRDVALTFYFWPEDKTSPTSYRIMHAWQNGKNGWHIIGGMDCEVPGSSPSKPLVSATSDVQQPVTKSDDKAAVEAIVRDYEEAVQLFDFSRADALLAPNAKWIERSMPEAAAMGEGAGFWAEAKEAKVRVTNRPYDFEIHLQGDVAWVTLLVDVTMMTDNESARTLLARIETEETGKTSDPNQGVWRATYTESEVLVKTLSGWRISLGHTSRLPTKTN